MKNALTLVFLLFFTALWAQHKKITQPAPAAFYFQKNRKLENRQGDLVTDSIARKAFFKKNKAYIDAIAKQSVMSTNALPAVPLCSNGGFEEFEQVGSNLVLKNFEYTIGEPINPMQCKSVTEVANLRLQQYNPANTTLMAGTVPSNYIDEFIGNINAFDQYTLKINYKESSPTMGLVKAKRYKTNNETQLQFNYKAVLQSITENDHDNEQPYFKVRVVSAAGTVVDEFCLIGTPTNCIFTQAPYLEGGSIILYTPNWQSGILDISSIPNNEEFTIEFMAARCGLNGHFGYAYVDDICLLHSTESLQGSIELDPLYKICPTLPIQVCGSFSIPNSGGINAFITSLTLNVRNETNAIIYTSTVPPTIDLVNKRFCFDLPAGSLPNTIDGTYDVSATINFGITQTACVGTTFNSITDNDANPGWDIWFLNCTNCPLTVQPATLTLCDTDHNGKEFFNLTNAEAAIVGTQTGLTFSYYTSLANATTDTTPITALTNYESTSGIVYVRVTLNATCYKIIPLQLTVKNPFATISGILNICSGSTTLTASPGASYLWSGSSATTQSITATTTGIYNVTVTDSNGCAAVATVNILASGVAPLPSITLSQPTCFTSTGTITVTSPASEYSFDNGVTWGTNPIMANLPYGTYAVKVRTASGCTSYSSTVNLIPFLSSFPYFSSTSPTSCGGLGSITVTSAASEYSFDDGVTWTTNNTLSGLPTGTYLIRTKDAMGCISNFNSVPLISEFLDAPLYIKENPFCGNPGSIEITTPATEYSFDGGTTWQTSNILTNLSTGSYIIKIKDAQGCTSPNVYVYLTNFQNTYPDYTLTDAGCGTYASILITTPGDFYSFDAGVTWTTNPFLGNLNGPSLYKIMVKKGANCKSSTEYVYINSQFLPLPVVTPYLANVCDSFNDGTEPVDLTLYSTYLVANAANYTFAYYTSALAAENADFSGLISNITACVLSNTNNKVYVRITSADQCHSVAELSVHLIDSPRVTMDDRYRLCEFKSIYVDAGHPYSSYLWSTGQTNNPLFINHDGDYWVTVTENHGALVCSTRKDFTVFLSNPATITKIEEIDWTEVDNSIIITVTGLGIYEYSLDGNNYQDSNTFPNLKPGIYQVFVRDKYGCGVVDDTALLLNYPKFFTPNGDGFNDYWRIRFSQFEPGITIRIFDRYGKLLKVMGNMESWDGTYNGRLVPSDDYWFYVIREDGKIHKGHFAMKR